MHDVAVERRARDPGQEWENCWTGNVCSEPGGIFLRDGNEEETSERVRREHLKSSLEHLMWF